MRSQEKQILKSKISVLKNRSFSKFGCDLGRSGRPCEYIPEHCVMNNVQRPLVRTDNHCVVTDDHCVTTLCDNNIFNDNLTFL